MNPSYHQRWFELRPRVQGADLMYWEKKAHADAGRSPKGTYCIKDAIDSRASGSIVNIYFWETKKIAQSDVLVLRLFAPSQHDAKDWAEHLRSAMPAWEGLLNLAQRKTYLLQRALDDDHKEKVGILSAIYDLYSSAESVVFVSGIGMIPRPIDPTQGPKNDLSQAELRTLIIDVFRMQRRLVLQDACAKLPFTNSKDVVLHQKEHIQKLRDCFAYWKSKEEAVTYAHVDECRQRLIGNYFHAKVDPATPLTKALFLLHAPDAFLDIFQAATPAS